MRSVEAMGEDVVEEQQRSRDVMAESSVHELKIVVGVEYIEYRYCLFIRDRIAFRILCFDAGYIVKSLTKYF